MAAFSPAAERNKFPIGELLTEYLPETGTVLEIGSGTAQHVLHFASLTPAVTWQPSEHPEGFGVLCESISTNSLAGESTSNILPPIILDVLQPDWPQGPFSAAYSANTAHIMPWAAVLAMINGVSQCIDTGSSFYLYGPFKVGGEHTADSNQAFDQALRSQVPHRGIRDREALEESALSCGLAFVRAHQMPANNQLLVFTKLPK